MSSQRRPISATRSRLIQATPQAIFALLSEPANLALVMPRIDRVEVLQRSATQARVRTHMHMGPVGNLTSTGEVQWVTDRELTFCAERPVLVTSTWLLQPEQQATRVIASMTLDLSPMLGPLAGFVPTQQVTAMIEPDLEAALNGIARQLEQRG